MSERKGKELKTEKRQKVNSYQIWNSEKISLLTECHVNFFRNDFAWR